MWSFLQPRLEQDPVEVQGSKNHGAPAPSTTAAWCWHDLCLSAQKRLPTEKFTHARCSSVYGEGYGLIFFCLCIVYIYEICICTCIEMPHLFLHKNRSFLNKTLSKPRAYKGWRMISQQVAVILPMYGRYHAQVRCRSNAERWSSECPETWSREWGLGQRRITHYYRKCRYTHLYCYPMVRIITW